MLYVVYFRFMSKQTEPKKSAILVTSAPNNHFHHELNKYFDVTVFDIAQLSYFTGYELPQADVLFNRISFTKNIFLKEILHQLEKRVGKVFNSLDSIQSIEDKFKQYLLLNELGINTPDIFIASGKPNHQHLEKFLSNYNSEDFIIKPLRGMKGIGVNLVNSKDQLRSWLETFYHTQDQEYLFQPYIKDEEFRAFISQGEVKLLLKREGKSFKANFNQGGVAQSLNEIPKELNQIAFKITDKTGLDYFTIDYFRDDFNIIDINSCPGISQVPVGFLSMIIDND